MASSNRYAGKCVECKVAVEANAGILRRSKRGRYYVLCSEHSGYSSQSVSRMSLTARNPGLVILGNGTEIWQNPGGRCEDAPCCGCCS